MMRRREAGYVSGWGREKIDCEVRIVGRCQDCLEMNAGLKGESIRNKNGDFSCS